MDVSSADIIKQIQTVSSLRYRVEWQFIMSISVTLSMKNDFKSSI